MMGRSMKEGAVAMVVAVRLEVATRCSGRGSSRSFQELMEGGMQAQAHIRKEEKVKLVGEKVMEKPLQVGTQSTEFGGGHAPEMEQSFPESTEKAGLVKAVDIEVVRRPLEARLRDFVMGKAQECQVAKNWLIHVFVAGSQP